MRYYAIEIYEPRQNNSEERVLLRQFASHKNGVYNPGALQIEMDISRYNFATPTQESRVTIWGLAPGDMQQDTYDLVGKDIAIYGGMLNGLPLSKSGVSGLIVQGQIRQVLGNWQGAELRMDLIINCGPYRAGAIETSTHSDLNFTLEWRAGETLASALENCFLNNGNFSYEIDVSDRLVNAFDCSMFSGSLAQLAESLLKVSLNIITDENYMGVRVTFQEGRIKVFDSPKTRATGSLRKVTQLKFDELIGQPVWIKYGTVSAIVVMRHDLQVGDIMRLPAQARPISIQDSWPHLRNRLAFTGDFIIMQTRFLGNSRTPNANSWVTVVEGVTTLAKGSDK